MRKSGIRLIIAFSVEFIFLSTLGVKYLYGLCPVPDKEPPYNIVEGTIEKIVEPKAPFSIPISDVLIWVDKTNFLSKANEKGYFFITDINKKEIVLRFEYAGQRKYLNVGKVGWGKKIKIKGIVLGSESVSYSNIDIISYIETPENNVE